MTPTPHCYTSITSNYLPKARVLAASVKRAQPAAQFHLMLSDQPPPGFDLAQEPFDSLLTVADLPLAEPKPWIFKHSVVELCTAVKGLAAQEIARRTQAAHIFYFDPDMVVFSGLDRLGSTLDQHSILLTPHLTVPESTRQGILDNEISALKHGVYNLGFIGINLGHQQGRDFLDWWSARLLDFCYDDICGGLFTDQRWVDLAPSFFDAVGILRGPEYNVATWNLSTRTATGSLEEGLLINGQPLSFYHFSGFDGGAQEVMLGRYGRSSPVLFKLREWYISACQAQGQDSLGTRPSIYASFDNGEPIARLHRLLYRERDDLRAAFPDPFDTSDRNRSYYHWFQANGPSLSDGDQLPEAALRIELSAAQQQLAEIQRSRSWKLARGLSRAFRVIKR